MLNPPLSTSSQPGNIRNSETPQGHLNLSGLGVVSNPQSNNLMPPSIYRSCSLSWFLTLGQWRAGLSWIPSYATLLFGNPFENPKRPHGFCSTIKSDLLGNQFGTITSVQTPVTCIGLLPHLSDEVMYSSRNI